MTKDRLLELQTKSSKYHKNSLKKIKSSNPDDEYFNEIKKDIIELDRMRKDILASVKNDPLYKSQADKLEKEIISRASDLNKNITELKKTLEDENFLSENPTKKRIFSCQINSISIDYSNLISDLSNQQTSYKESLKKQIKLKFDLANEKQYTDEELEKAIESPEFCHFTGNILAETQEARMQLEEIQTRHKKIIEIEKSLNELRDMFVTFNAMVTSQGQIIDNIAINVTSAKEAGISANKNLKQALLNKKSARKKKIICALIIAIILLVIIISSVLSKALS